MAAPNRWAIWTLYFVVFVDLFQVTFVFPFVPSIVTSFYDSHDADAKSKIATSVAILSSLAAIGEMVGSPVLGSLSDRFGRRPIFLVATLGSAGSAALLGYAHSMPIAIIARVLNGLSGGTGGIANTYLVDITTPEERPGYMSTLTAYVGIGLAVGPIVGGWLYLWKGVKVACLCASAISFLNFLCIFAFIKETNPNIIAAREARLVEQQPAAQALAAAADGSAGAAERGAAPAAAAGGGDAGAAAPKAKLPLKLWVLFLASFFQNPIFVVFDTFANLYVTERFYNGDEQKGTQLFSHCVATVGVGLFVIPLFIYQPFLRCVGFNASIVIGSIFIIVGMVANGAAWTDNLFLAATLIWTIGFQLCGPVVPILISRLADPSAVGAAFGLFNSFGNASRVIGPAALTPLYNWYHPSVFYFLAISMIAVGSIYLYVSVTSATEASAAAAEEAACGAEAAAAAEQPPRVRAISMPLDLSRHAAATAMHLERQPSTTASSMAAFGCLPEQLVPVKAELVRQASGRSGSRPVAASSLLTVEPARDKRITANLGPRSQTIG